MFGPGSRAGVLTEIVRTATLSSYRTMIYDAERGRSLRDRRPRRGGGATLFGCRDTIAGHRDFGSARVTSVQADLPNTRR